MIVSHHGQWQSDSTVRKRREYGTEMSVAYSE